MNDSQERGVFLIVVAKKAFAGEAISFTGTGLQHFSSWADAGRLKRKRRIRVFTWKKIVWRLVSDDGANLIGDRVSQSPKFFSLF